jgi:Dolichyl-phosphate-mannose-protein mannosyltransferase
VQATKRSTIPRTTLLVGLLFVAVLIIGAYLRFAHLVDNPGWDSDEGYNWSIANNLSFGQLRMYGLAYAFVQHPPLFYLICAAVMRLWTHDLIALRVVTASSGLLTIVALFGIGRRLGGPAVAVGAMSFYALWPQAVLQTRWAYTYNLLALLVLLAMWAALPVAMSSTAAGDERASHVSRPAGPHTIRAALIAGLLTGLAMTTDQEAIALVPAIAVLLRPGGFRGLILAAASAAIAPIAYISWMLATRGSDFLFDIHHTASRLTAGPGEIITRLEHLVTFDPFIALGMVGLFMLSKGTVRSGFVVLIAAITLLLLEVRDPSPYFRAAEPLLPLAALGVGMLVGAALSYLSRFGTRARHSSEHSRTDRQGKLFRRFAAALLIAPFVLSMTVLDLRNVNGHFATGISSLLPRSASDARAMATWVNARVGPTDLVLVMPSTSWLFHCHTADFLQSVAISGHGTAFYPDGLRRDRFLYDTRPIAARFVVVDDFTRLWIRESKPGQVIVDGVVKNWPEVYARGEYAVYENPSIGDS